MKNLFKSIVGLKAFNFLVIGKTAESTEATGFKRYVGLASSHVLAVNPDKAKLDELMGFESQGEPEYVKEDEQGKYVNVTFIVRTDPDTNNGISITNRAIITLRPQPAYNRDQTKVQVLDNYGNFAWVNVEDAKAGVKPANVQKLDNKFRMACVGECALVDFLKKFLNVPDAYNYANGTWVKKAAEEAEKGLFSLDIKAITSGDVKDVRDAIALQPNNKIKLLYGVRTANEGKQYQAICMREQMMLNNAAGTGALAKLEKDLTESKNRGSYANIDYRVQALQEYDVKPTNLGSISDDLPTGTDDFSSELPWQ